MGATPELRVIVVNDINVGVQENFGDSSIYIAHMKRNHLITSIVNFFSIPWNYSRKTTYETKKTRKTKISLS